MIMLYLALPAAGLEIFVSPQGNDSWSGTLEQPNAQKSDGPLASLTAARDLVRTYKRKSKNADEAITITLRAGIYRLTESVQMGQADSGSEQAPVVIRAYAGEQPIISGGVEVTGFKTISPNIHGAPLPESIKDLDKVRLVLFQGRRLPLARWPNFDPKQPIAGGWAYVDGERPNKPYDKIPGETDANRSFFKMRKSDMRQWANPTEGDLFIFTRFNYWNDVVPISAVNKSTGQVDVKQPCSYAIRPGDRYFVQGMREELDAPGEWYIDRNTRQLLIYSSADPAVLKVEVSVSPTLIGLRSDASHIRLEGLTLQCATGAAINVVGAQHCEFRNCTIQHTGDLTGHGVALYDGEHNHVINCEINDVGASGVFTNGGDYKTLKRAEHLIQNCHIHHTGVINTHSGAVWLSGTGNSVLNNDMHDCPRMAVIVPFGGNNQLNVVEYNHIYQVNLQTQDSGAIYASGRDWVSGRGHRIRYNFIHDSIGFGWDGTKWASPYYAWGIYLDDACSSCEVVGNIVARCPRASIMIHSGQNNRIENNIFVDGGKQQIELRGWEAKYTYWQSLLSTMDKRYAETKDNAAWKEIVGYGPPRESYSQDGKVMVDNIIQRNIIAYKGRGALYMDVVQLPTDRIDCDNNLIFVKGQPPAILRDDKVMVTWKIWQAAGLDKRSKQADPKFKDPSKDDYRLSDDSPALRMGFEPIPVEKIGRQRL